MNRFVVAFCLVSTMTLAQSVPHGSTSDPLRQDDVENPRESKSDTINGIFGNSTGLTLQTGQSILDTGTRISICPTAACYNGLVGLLSLSSQEQTPGVSNWVLSSSLYSNHQATSDSDVAAYFGAAQGTKAANEWSLNSNIVRGSSPTTLGNGGTVLYPGAQVPLTSATVGYELDFGNWDQNTIMQGTGFTVGEYLHAAGYFTSQDAIYLDYNPLSGPVNGNTSNYAWKYGISMFGLELNQAADIYLNTAAGYAFQVLGAHKIGLDTTSDTAMTQAVNIHSGQGICLKGETIQDCLSYDDKAGNLAITNNVGSTNVVIQDSGNVVVVGSVTQAGRRYLQFSGIAITNSKGQSVISFGTRPDGTAWFAKPPSIMATPVNIPLTESVMVIGSTATTVTLQFYKTRTGNLDVASLSRGYTICASGS
jgi:hypothetical protein